MVAPNVIPASAPVADSLRAALLDPAVMTVLQEHIEQTAEKVAAQRSRADLIPGLCLVDESELTKHVPWSLEQIKAKRKAGVLPAIEDKTKPKGRKSYLYNLYDVWGAINGQGAGLRPVVRRIPADLDVKPLSPPKVSR